jgi:GNAT superfamily N-acetyltransferase
MTARSALGTALLQSDQRYFEIAADVVELEGAVVASMAGLEALAGACVVQRVEPRSITAGSDEWVGATTDHLRSIGCSVARIYLMEPDSGLDDALARAGFVKRLEIGYAAVGVVTAGRADVGLRAVAGELDWEAKRKVHAGSQTAADGHDSPADDWVELERRKCATGEMRAFLVEVDGEVCGAVATIDVPGVVRAKNLFVHATRRREGIGAGVIRALSGTAAGEGKAAVGIFGVPGNAGDALYRRLGMDPVVSQFEWSRPLRS